MTNNQFFTNESVLGRVIIIVYIYINILHLFMYDIHIYIFLKIHYMMYNIPTFLLLSLFSSFELIN